MDSADWVQWKGECRSTKDRNLTSSQIDVLFNIMQLL